MNRLQLCGRLFVFLCGFAIFELYSDQKPLVIVIPSYNNSKWYLQNLDSVFSQTYQNYRVIYIDDYSNDSTAQLVEQYVAQKHQEQRFLLIKNNKRCGALANHYKAVHMCENNEIVVQLDGDDWFKHENVLNIINEAYQDNDVWLTYGQYEMFPPEHPGISRKLSSTVILNNGYREAKWVTSALRTFYAGLFKRIKLQDLLYQGTFFKAACDLAFMYPMLEMCAGKVQFIDQIIYVYNCSTNCNDYKTMLQAQLHYDSVIRAQKKYPRLFTHPSDRGVLKRAIADIILFAESKENLDVSLKSISQFVSNFHQCIIVYNANSDIDYAIDQGLFAYDFIKFKPIFKSDDFKAIILNTLIESKASYLMTISDKWHCVNPVNLQACTKYLEKTGAYCFSFSLGKNIKNNSLLVREQKIPISQDLDEEVCAWQFMNGEYDWQDIHNFNATLYHKNDLKKIFHQLNFSSSETLLSAWSKFPVDMQSVGLFFDQSRVICHERLI